MSFGANSPSSLVQENSNYKSAYVSPTFRSTIFQASDAYASPQFNRRANQAQTFAKTALTQQTECTEETLNTETNENNPAIRLKSAESYKNNVHLSMMSLEEKKQMLKEEYYREMENLERKRVESLSKRKPTQESVREYERINTENSESKLKKKKAIYEQKVDYHRALSQQIEENKRKLDEFKREHEENRHRRQLSSKNIEIDKVLKREIFTTKSPFRYEASKSPSPGRSQKRPLTERGGRSTKSSELRLQHNKGIIQSQREKKTATTTPQKSPATARNQRDISRTPSPTRRETEDFIIKNMKEVSISTIKDFDESIEKHGYNSKMSLLLVSLDNTPTESRTFERNPFAKNAFEEALSQMRKLKEEEEEQRREIKFESLKTQYNPTKNIQKTIQAATNPRKVNKSSSITNLLQQLNGSSPKTKGAKSSLSPNKAIPKPTSPPPQSKQRLDTISECASALIPNDQQETGKINKGIRSTTESKKNSIDFTATRTTLATSQQMSYTHRRTMTSDSTNFRKVIEEESKPKDETLHNERMELMDAFTEKKNSLLAYLRGLKERGTQLQMRKLQTEESQKNEYLSKGSPKQFLVPPPTTLEEIDAQPPGRIKQNIIHGIQQKERVVIASQKSNISPERQTKFPIKNESPNKPRLRINFPKN